MLSFAPLVGFVATMPLLTFITIFIFASVTTNYFLLSKKEK
jgi:hypothetical protein